MHLLNFRLPASTCEHLLQDTHLHEAPGDEVIVAAVCLFCSEWTNLFISHWVGELSSYFWICNFWPELESLVHVWFFITPWLLQRPCMLPAIHKINGKLGQFPFPSATLVARINAADRNVTMWLGDVVLVMWYIAEGKGGNFMLVCHAASCSEFSTGRKVILFYAIVSAFLPQIIRQQFPSLTTRRLGTRGQSKSVKLAWYGGGGVAGTGCEHFSSPPAPPVQYFACNNSSMFPMFPGTTITAWV